MKPIPILLFITLLGCSSASGQGENSLNKLNHYHGNGIGWYSVNPWEVKI